MAKKVASKKQAAKTTTAKTGGAKAPKAAAPKKAAAKGAAKGAKAPAPKTVTLKHLAAGVAGQHAMPARQAEALVNGVFDTLVGHIKAGDKVRIAGLGIIEVKHRAARMGRNPATGEAIQIKASRKVAFRAAKDLKEAI